MQKENSYQLNLELSNINSR